MHPKHSFLAPAHGASAVRDAAVGFLTRLRRFKRWPKGPMSRTTRGPVGNRSGNDVASGPFASCDAVAFRALLLSHMGDPSHGDLAGFFECRAMALIDALGPALVWLRDVKGVGITADAVRLSTGLPWIWSFAAKGVALVRDAQTRAVTEIDVRDTVPQPVTKGLQSYLGELPGCDLKLPLDQQNREEPVKQHAYASMYISLALFQITSDLAGGVPRAGGHDAPRPPSASRPVLQPLVMPVMGTPLDRRA